MKLQKKSSRSIIIVAVIVVIIVAALATAFGWYKYMLSPLDKNSNEVVRINITKGMTGASIASSLEQRKVIRSALAFSIYIKLNGGGSGLQAGVYGVKASQSLPEIANHLLNSKPDERAITFFPEATLSTKKSNSDGREVYSVLKKSGFSDQDIQSALSNKYSSYILKDLPKDADLEGYVYGETYFMSSSASASQVIERAINEFSSIAKKHNLESKFNAKGLNLHQGITLASIVQKESKGCGAKVVCEDQRQIAGVFYNRLKADIPLGSDVTYHYAADKTGVKRNHRLDSPYNTRIHKGLPPGPIAVPGLSALNAVADPAQHDFLYFLSGDDDKTYFARTDQEHQANIKNHCAKKCLLP